MGLVDQDTLHGKMRETRINGQVLTPASLGGIFGWDRRNWTITRKSRTSVTYRHIDAADEGFPGTVTALVSVLGPLTAQ